MCPHKESDTALAEARISHHELVAEDLWRMSLLAPGWTGPDAEPGQFLMLRVAEGTDPLLARPFGISGFERAGEDAVVEIIYRVVGRGTRTMSQWPEDRNVRFLGPLGRGFDLPPEGSRSLLVAGGVGLPPLLALARRMADLGRSEELELLYGEASRGRLVDLEARIFPAIAVRTCTEDGTCGTAGLVTDLLAERKNGRDSHLFVCGPNPMMKAVMKTVDEGCLSAQYSLEARMACGFGVCSGCAVLTRQGDYLRVCREGPVFDGSELTPESFGEI